MDTKIQELTDKIYKEGVEKGKVEAERIVKDAQLQKEKLIADAEAQAKQIVAAAEKQSAEMKKNAEAELKLFAMQSIEALKSEITNLITGKVVSANVKAAMADGAFMQKVIVELVRNWGSDDLVIQSSDAAELEKYFMSNAKYLLDKGVQIQQVNGKKASFTIAPADGSYKVSFGEEEFVEYFKEFLRPQLIDALF